MTLNEEQLKKHRNLAVLEIENVLSLYKEEKLETIGDLLERSEDLPTGHLEEDTKTLIKIILKQHFIENINEVLKTSKYLTEQQMTAADRESASRRVRMYMGLPDNKNEPEVSKSTLPTPKGPPSNTTTEDLVARRQAELKIGQQKVREDEVKWKSNQERKEIDEKSFMKGADNKIQNIDASIEKNKSNPEMLKRLQDLKKNTEIKKQDIETQDNTKKFIEKYKTGSPKPTSTQPSNRSNDRNMGEPTNSDSNKSNTGSVDTDVEMSVGKKEEPSTGSGSDTGNEMQSSTSNNKTTDNKQKTGSVDTDVEMSVGKKEEPSTGSGSDTGNEMQSSTSNNTSTANNSSSPTNKETLMSKVRTGVTSMWNKAKNSAIGKTIAAHPYATAAAGVAAAGIGYALWKKHKGNSGEAVAELKRRRSECEDYECRARIDQEIQKILLKG